MNLMLQRRRIIKAAAGLVGFGSTAGVVNGQGRGNAGGNQRGNDGLTVESGASIQAAIDSADSGDTIIVEAGTYREQLIINKDLEIRGREGATVEAPDEMAAFTIDESPPQFEPIVFAYGGSVGDGHVSGSETVDVSITGLEVDGRDLQPDVRRKVGVFYRNVRGNGRTAIENTTVSAMGVGGRETMGILVYGDSDVVIESNVVRGFERGGIGGNGDGTEHPSPHIVVRNNEVDSNSSPRGWAPNGVQIGYGASGSVRNNRIQNCRWAVDADEDWAASAILLFESDDVQVMGNEVENCDLAVGVASWGWLLPSASNNTVQGTNVRDVLVGISIDATASEISERDPEVRNNKVINNEIVNGDPALGATGIEVFTVDTSDDYDPVVSNTKVIRNTINGFDEKVADEGTASKVQAVAF